MALALHDADRLALTHCKMFGRHTNQQTQSLRIIYGLVNQ